MEIQKQRRIGTGIILAAVGLCALTAVGLVIRGRAQSGAVTVGTAVDPPPPPAERPDAPTLPAYIMNMAGGDIDLHAATPGDPMGPPIIANPGARLEFAVRAEVEVKIRVHVKLFWRKGDRMERWQPDVQYGPFSTYRYRGLGVAPFGQGAGDLIAIVSPYPDIPDKVFASWLRHPPRHWQIMRQPVVWQ
jgi:hypothetical protein